MTNPALLKGIEKLTAPPVTSTPRKSIYLPTFRRLSSLAVEKPTSRVRIKHNSRTKGKGFPKSELGSVPVEFENEDLKTQCESKNEEQLNHQPIKKKEDNNKVETKFNFLRASDVIQRLYTFLPNCSTLLSFK